MFFCVTLQDIGNGGSHYPKKRKVSVRYQPSNIFADYDILNDLGLEQEILSIFERHKDCKVLGIVKTQYEHRAIYNLFFQKNETFEISQCSIPIDHSSIVIAPNP